MQVSDGNHKGFIPRGVGRALSVGSQMIEKYSQMFVDSPGLQTCWQVCSSEKEPKSSLEM